MAYFVQRPVRLSSRLALSFAAATGLWCSTGSAHAAAVGETIDWQGVTWDVYSERSGTEGNAVLDTNGDLLLNLTKLGTIPITSNDDPNSAVGIRVNRLPDIPGGGSMNANGTPFIQFSFQGTTNADHKIELAIDDETILNETPRIAAGSLFGASQVVNSTYGNGSTERNANFDYPLFAGDLTEQEHTVLIGKDATGRFYFRFDDEIGQSDNIRDGIGDFDFNDVSVRVRGSLGDSIRLTELTFGDDFTVAMLPEPTSLALLGLGGLTLISRRSRRSARA